MQERNLILSKYPDTNIYNKASVTCLQIKDFLFSLFRDQNILTYWWLWCKSNVWIRFIWALSLCISCLRSRGKSLKGAISSVGSALSKAPVGFKCRSGQWKSSSAISQMQTGLLALVHLQLHVLNNKRKRPLSGWREKYTDCRAVISLFILRFGRAINAKNERMHHKRIAHWGRHSAPDLVLICQLELELQPKQWTDRGINGKRSPPPGAFWRLLLFLAAESDSSELLLNRWSVRARWIYSACPCRPVITGNSFGVNDDLSPQCRDAMPVKSLTHSGPCRIMSRARVMQNLVQIVSTHGCRHALPEWFTVY